MIMDAEYVEAGCLGATLSAMRRGEGAGMLFLFDAVPYREWQVNRFTTPLRARLEELRTITDGISSPFVDYLHHAPVTAEEIGRAHVRTPVTTAHHVSRLLHEKHKKNNNHD